MAETAKVTISEIYDGARETISNHRDAVLLYLAAFIPLTMLGNVLDQAVAIEDSGAFRSQANFSNEPPGILFLALSVIGQYFVIERMLAARETRRHTFGRLLGFIGLGIVSFLGVILATVFFLIPGLLVGARWLMCICFYVGEGRGVFNSLGASWAHARGNTFAIAMSILIQLVLLTLANQLLSSLATAIRGSPDPWLLTYLFDAVLSELFAVALIALSVSAYSRLGEQRDRLVDIFA